MKLLIHLPKYKTTICCMVLKETDSENADGWQLFFPCPSLSLCATKCCALSAVVQRTRLDISVWLGTPLTAAHSSDHCEEKLGILPGTSCDSCFFKLLNSDALVIAACRGRVVIQRLQILYVTCSLTSEACLELLGGAVISEAGARLWCQVLKQGNPRTFCAVHPFRCRGCAEGLAGILLPCIQCSRTLVPVLSTAWRKCVLSQILNLIKMDLGVF